VIKRISLQHLIPALNKIKNMKGTTTVQHVLKTSSTLS